MKKTLCCVVLAALCACIGFAFADTGSGFETDGYLRIHIRANSNSAEDQEVKYLVRDKVVEYLTPVVAECSSKEEAIKAVGNVASEAAKVADRTLRENGYTYGARATVRREEFPTRVYDDVTLEAGEYDALIVELGTGEGDNWWCVVYPPLCFAAGNGNIVYRSKIAEIIRSFQNQ